MPIDINSVKIMAFREPYYIFYERKAHIMFPVNRQSQAQIVRDVTFTVIVPIY